MKSELLAAIQDRKYWMDNFTRRGYFEAFKKYTQTYAQPYLTAIREAKDEAGRAALAGDLMDALEAGWAKERIWNRTKARFSDKEMLINYLSPMLLGLEDEACGDFAKQLQAVWAERLPKEAYGLATYKQLRQGFRNAILGMEFRDDLREMEEAQEEAENQKK